MLAPNEKISYTISIGVPADATVGVHQLYTVVKYRWLQGGNWSSESDLFWVDNVQVDGAPTTQNTITGPSQTLTPEAIILLIGVTVIGLFLERGRIRRALGAEEKRQDKAVQVN